MKATQNISILSFIILLILSTILRLSESAQHCNPNDEKALLQIKKHFNNASPFATWKPSTDCCNWDNIGCYDDNLPGRVTSVTVAYGTDLSGEIPPAVGDLPYLNSLRFFELPNLTGSIPLAITKLKYLETLDLSSNNLTGPVPDFLSRIKTLQLVALSANNLSGSIPSSLSQLPNLFELDLETNKLTGSIPESFGSFKTGLTLQVSGNKLSGPLPRSLGRANFTILDVSENRFTGDASFLFGRDKQYNFINLSQNKFKFDFSNVGLPRGLKYLYMAYNEIYGSLPRELGQLPLRNFDVSHNQLCGRIPTGRRLKRFKPESFEHNKCLCGVPLPPCK